MPGWLARKLRPRAASAASAPAPHEENTGKTVDNSKDNDKEKGNDNGQEEEKHKDKIKAKAKTKTSISDEASDKAKDKANDKVGDKARQYAFPAADVDHASKSTDTKTRPMHSLELPSFALPRSASTHSGICAPFMTRLRGAAWHPSSAASQVSSHDPPGTGSQTETSHKPTASAPASSAGSASRAAAAPPRPRPRGSSVDPSGPGGRPHDGAAPQGWAAPQGGFQGESHGGFHGGPARFFLRTVVGAGKKANAPPPPSAQAPARTSSSPTQANAPPNGGGEPAAAAAATAQARDRAEGKADLLHFGFGGAPEGLASSLTIPPNHVVAQKGTPPQLGELPSVRPLSPDELMAKWDKEAMPPATHATRV